MRFLDCVGEVKEMVFFLDATISKTKYIGKKSNFSKVQGMRVRINLEFVDVCFRHLFLSDLSATGRTLNQTRSVMCTRLCVCLSVCVCVCVSLNVCILFIRRKNVSLRLL
jgi:hypothetical protein